MGSAGERPDLDALHELEEVLHHLADELRVAEQLRVQGVGDTSMLRLRELEEENLGLEQRLGTARAKLSDLVGRLGFLEEQAHVSEARGQTAKS
jgi:hypothetical protein